MTMIGFLALMSPPRWIWVSTATSFTFTIWWKATTTPGPWKRSTPTILSLRLAITECLWYGATNLGTRPHGCYLTNDYNNYIHKILSTCLPHLKTEKTWLCGSTFCKSFAEESTDRFKFVDIIFVESRAQLNGHVNIKNDGRQGYTGCSSYSYPIHDQDHWLNWVNFIMTYRAVCGSFMENDINSRLFFILTHQTNPIGNGYGWITLLLFVVSRMTLSCHSFLFLTNCFFLFNSSTLP